MINNQTTIEDEKGQVTLPRPLAVQAEEYELLSPSQKRSVSQWAEQERVMSKKTTPYSGRWSNDFAPPAVRIMDSLSNLVTKEVWVRAPAQWCKTEIGLNWIGQTVTDDPGPMMCVMPTEELVKKQLRTRIKDMFELSPALLKHLSGGEIKNLRVSQETDLVRMILYHAWAGSAAMLADTPLRKIKADEIAKYKDAVGSEAGSVNLLRDRLFAWRAMSKLFAPSTPVIVDDEHDREYKNTDQQEYWIKCPFCNQRHIPVWEYVELDKDSARQLLSPADYVLGDCARYVCPECGVRWTELDRWAAVTAGRWAPRDCKVDPAGRIIGKVFGNPKQGFQVSCFIINPCVVEMRQVACEWAEAQLAKKAGNIKPLQNIINSRFGQPWEEREKQTDVTRLALHITTNEPEIVPHGVQVITAGLDVQIDHVWALLLGWGWMSELWVIDGRRIETGDTSILASFDIVADYLTAGWALEADDERRIGIVKAAIDCGYRPEVVKNFCRKHQGLPMIPVFGSPTLQAQVYSKKTLPDGLSRYALNVNAIKDTLHQLIYSTTEVADSKFHLHSKTSKEMLKHLTSEEQIKIRGRRGVREKLIWKAKTQSGQSSPNHLWDALVSAYFAGLIRGATMLRDPDRKSTAPKRRVGQMDRLRR